MKGQDTIESNKKDRMALINSPIYKRSKSFLALNPKPLNATIKPRVQALKTPMATP